MTQTANQRVVREYVQRGHIQQADNAIPTTRNKLKVKSSNANLLNHVIKIY